MFNHILAAMLGITAIILGIVTAIKFDLFSAQVYDQTTSKEAREKDIYDFLNDLDDTRESRYAKDRSRMLRQFDGFRSEWNSYSNEYGCNYHEFDFSCSIYA